MEYLKKNNKLERLTRWENNDKDVADLIEGKSDFDGLTEAINRLAEYEDSGLSPEEVQELAKAKAEGRLVVLPLPIGSTAFDISQGFIEPMGKIHVTFAYGQRGIIYHMPMGIFLDGLNKGLIKLTREEAEKALEVRE
jgi:hypothetical protein